MESCFSRRLIARITLPSYAIQVRALRITIGAYQSATGSHQELLAAREKAQELGLHRFGLYLQEVAVLDAL